MAILDRDRDAGDLETRAPPSPHHPGSQAQTPVAVLRAPEGKPYHAKRPHRKSRLGCRSCKARKVKCDEAKPSCRNCTVRQEACVYPSRPPQPSVTAAAPAPAPVPTSVTSGSPLSLRTASSPAPPSTSLLLAQRSSPCPSSSSRRGSDDGLPNGRDSTELVMVAEPSIGLAGADEYDMRLLWFYTNETYASVSVEAGRIPYVDGILRSQIVRFAFQSPFLMDCILGLSAMHMQSLNMKVPMSKAITYRARAFSGYRRAIESARPRDYPALLATSILLCALSSELFREPDMRPLYIIDWMVVWRGIGLIMEVVPTEALFSSGLDKLFSRPAFNINQAALYVPSNLLSMITSIKEDDDDFPYVDAYYGALKFLGGLYLELEIGFSVVLSLRIMTFYTFLPKPFIELGRKHRPRALVILAHHLVFLKMIENVWWLVGIADRGIQDILDHVGPEWRSLLGVPRAALGLYDKVELARLIESNHAWRPAEIDEIASHPDPNSRKYTMVNNVGEEVVYDKKRGWVPLVTSTVQGGDSSCSHEYLSPPNT